MSCRRTMLRRTERRGERGMWMFDRCRP
jgi:hypothetical protein